VFLLDPDAGHRRHPGRGDASFERAGADAVTAICLLAAPEGVAAVEAAFGPDAPVTIVVAAMDERSTTAGTSSPGSATPATGSYGVV
jgi:uracil phosphoribosyltransferase